MTTSVRSSMIINPYKPSVPFLGHWQTVQIQIRRRRTRRLIRVFTVCLQDFYSKYNKNEKVHQTPLQLEMGSSN